MTVITPCLWFDGNGLEAAEFYVSVLPNSRVTQVTHYGQDRQDEVLTVAFELDGQPYVALNGGPEFSFTCACVKDRFGLSWQVVPDELPLLLSDPNPLRANAALQAMMGMKKIDIQALRDAADAVG
jgi:predicted 3-demethylubiquinone-9 3-methyltransferase (glyoxalase superfamily)